MSRMLFCLVDLVILGLSYLAADWLADGRIRFGSYHSNLIPFAVLWIVFSFINDKYSAGKRESLIKDIKAVLLSNFNVVALSSLLIFGFKYGDISRLVFLVAPFIATVAEIALITLLKQSRWRALRREIGALPKPDSSEYAFALYDLIIWVSSYLGVFSFYFFSGSIKGGLLEPYMYLLVYSTIVSYIASLLTRKMQVKGKISFSDYLIPVINSSAITMIALAVAIVAFQRYEISRTVVFLSVAVSFVFDLFIVSILFNNRISGVCEEDEDLHLLAFQAVLCKVKEVEEIYNPRKFYYQAQGNETLYHRLEKDLSNAEIGFVSLNIDIGEAPGDIPLLISSGPVEELDGYADDFLEVLFNKTPVNEIAAPNQYFRKVHLKLKGGGYFIGSARTSDLGSIRNREDFTRPVYVGLVAINFLVEDILLRSLGLQKVFNIFGSKVRHSFSKTEVLGRLVVCGFKNIDVTHINNRMYFIAYKASEPKADQLQLYSAFINLRRLGKFGRDILVYKFRTMYPYSEYLRDFAIQKCGYVETGDGAGKIENDFRVTEIGRIMRKYWLDELPQLINILRGEIKLVGVRPLEPGCLKTYPLPFLKRRLKYKPGLLAPYAAHIHRNMDEYIQAEIRYLDEYDRHPFLTDLKYFFWITWNILTGKVRSQ